MRALESTANLQQWDSIREYLNTLSRALDPDASKTLGSFITVLNALHPADDELAELNDDARPLAAQELQAQGGGEAASSGMEPGYESDTDGESESPEFNKITAAIQGMGVIERVELLEAFCGVTTKSIIPNTKNVWDDQFMKEYELTDKFKSLVKDDKEYDELFKVNLTMLVYKAYVWAQKDPKNAQQLLVGSGSIHSKKRAIFYNSILFPPAEHAQSSEGVQPCTTMVTTLNDFELPYIRSVREVSQNLRKAYGAGNVDKVEYDKVREENKLKLIQLMRTLNFDEKQNNTLTALIVSADEKTISTLDFLFSKAAVDKDKIFNCACTMMNVESKYLASLLDLNDILEIYKNPRIEQLLENIEERLQDVNESSPSTEPRHDREERGTPEQDASIDVAALSGLDDLLARNVDIESTEAWLLDAHEVVKNLITKLKGAINTKQLLLQQGDSSGVAGYLGAEAHLSTVAAHIDTNKAIIDESKILIYALAGGTKVAKLLTKTVDCLVKAADPCIRQIDENCSQALNSVHNGLDSLREAASRQSVTNLSSIVEEISDVSSIVEEISGAVELFSKARKVASMTANTETKRAALRRVNLTVELLLPHIIELDHLSKELTRISQQRHEFEVAQSAPVFSVSTESPRRDNGSNSPDEEVGRLPPGHGRETRDRSFFESCEGDADTQRLLAEAAAAAAAEESGEESAFVYPPPPPEGRAVRYAFGSTEGHTLLGGPRRTPTSKHGGGVCSETRILSSGAI